jgi:AcrR family transcriptional regulator
MLLADLLPQMERLPRGRHGLSDEYVAQNQRERLIDAVTECLSEVGYDKTTVAAVGKRAHVSKADFYKHFESKDECFLAAYDAAVELLRARIRSACAEEADWVDRVCSGLRALLDFLVEEPARANLLLVEGLRGGREVYDRFQQAVRSFVPDLRRGAPAVGGGGQPPETTDEAVVGGVASLLGRRVLAGETDRLAEFFPEVAEFALTPYLGAAEARRIIPAR